MSEFDFLSRVPIGQYVETGSILHRVDARVKITIFTTLVIVLTFSKSIPGLTIGLAFLLFAVAISRIKFGFVLKGLLPPLPFLVIIAVIQVFLFSAASDPRQLFSIGSLHITLTGVMAGITLLIRFTALILCLSLASMCISTSELIQGTQRLLSPLNLLKIKTMDLVMIIQVTLRFLPFLAQTAERIAKAQASRGAEWGVKSRGLFNRVRQIVPLIIPLFIISLRRAENLALAMDARAYGFLDHRTSIGKVKFDWSDFAVLSLNTIVSLAILWS